MYRELSIALSGLFILLSSIGFTQTALPDSVLKALRDGMKGFSERYHSPGMAVAIVHDQQTVFAEGTGYIDAERKIPSTADSKYPILSVSKTFTATMLMQLVQRNVVALNDDVRKYVPEYRGNNYPTTLLQLATHTAGLPRNSPADIAFTKQVDQWFFGGIKYSTLEAPSKKHFLRSLNYVQKEYPEYEYMNYSDRHYSNLGYALLGVAIERAAKMSYQDYLKKNVLQPLKMTSTGFDDERYVYKDLAQGYFYDDTLKELIAAPRFKSNSLIYAGGMYSTANDLAKYISFYFTTSRSSEKVLSVQNKAMMHAFKIAWKPAFPFVLHEGAMVGYRSVVVMNPSLKVGWVILTNASDFEFSRINEYISKLVIPVYTRKVLTGLDRFVGTYKLNGGYGMLKISVKNDTLYSDYLPELFKQSPLKQSGSNSFKSHSRGGYSISYEFIEGDEGKIKYLNLGQLMWVKQ
jgi:CubicO group peptidase (beta-lactamase class C family)